MHTSDDKYDDDDDDGENANHKQGSVDYALEERAGPASSSSSRALTGFNFFIPVGDFLHDWERFCPIFYLWGMVGMVGRGFFSEAVICMIAGDSDSLYFGFKSN